jgi:hypothetical protein
MSLFQGNRMCNRRVVLLAFGLAVLFLLLPVRAGLWAAPLAGICTPENLDKWGPDCKPSSSQLVPAGSVPVPSPLPPAPSVLTYTYAYVTTGPVGLYTSPADAENGVAPIKVLDKGYVWVRLVGQVVYGDHVWYVTESGGYLPGSLVAIYKPSTFQGIVVQNRPVVPFAWVLNYVQTSAKPGARPDANGTWYRRYQLVNIYEAREADQQIWYRVGENQWLAQTNVAKVEWKQQPSQVGPGEKWIDVSLFEQTLAAYEGDRMVYATLISSGLPQWSTVQGLFRIHSKYALGPMVGREGRPDFYALEGVPWSMYFYQDYALHGAYWHDGFGWQHSHGCVNLAPADAKWLYDWTSPVVPSTWSSKLATNAEPGTWVWVHD